MPNPNQHEGTGEVVAGAVAFLGGLALEKFANISGASIGGLAVGAALVVHGLSRAGRSYEQTQQVDRS